MLRVTMLALSMAVAVSGFGSAQAQDIKLPGTLTLTAYDTGTSGFNIAVAVGKVFKEKYSSDMRILPAGNDIARLAPLKNARAQASAMGIGSYFASEGVFEFAVKEWGPQPLRLLMSAASCNAITLNVAKDTGVKEVKDLKGKRIGIGRRLAGAQPERLRHPGLRQPDGEGRQAGRVLQLRRDVEGHDQQRGRRRGGIDHHRPGAGARDLAARRGDAADARVGHGGLGAPAEDRPLLLPAQDDLRRGWPEPDQYDRAAGLSLSDLHGLRLDRQATWSTR